MEDNNISMVPPQMNKVTYWPCGCQVDGPAAAVPPYCLTHDKRGDGANALTAPALTARVDFTRATELTPEVFAAIEDAFEYHKWTPEQIKAGKRIRHLLCQAVAQLILDVPAGPDRTVAIRKIREARMDANSAITHGGKY